MNVILRGRPFPETLEDGLNDLSDLQKMVEATGYEDRIKIDETVVRGLEYYTGPVFEVELLLETKDDKGRPVRFGSVGGGGRYDGLVSRFRGEPVPATGFSIGVSRLQAALAALGKLNAKPQPGPVVVTVFGTDNIARAQKLTALLRNAPANPNNSNGPKIRAELYLGNPKHGIGQQLKYADKRNSPCAVIQGPDEMAASKVLVRDLIAGAAPSNAADREAHLRAQAQAQVSVAEADLVAAVQKLLSRHKLNE
jgi:histidyl-tRNA synthetase